MSDLQCPAKVALIARETLDQHALDSTHYAGVFAVSAIASDVAKHANCRVELIADAVDAASLARALEELADIYRGYTIVVIATQEMIRDMIGDRANASPKPIVLAIDSSGWAVSE